MGFRRAPKRVIIQGNDTLARSHIGEADSLLNLCETQAGFQNLQQFQMVRNLEDGSQIIARMYAGLSDVIITSPFIPKEREVEKVEETIIRPSFKIMRVDGTVITPHSLDPFQVDPTPLVTRYAQDSKGVFHPWEFYSLGSSNQYQAHFAFYPSVPLSDDARVFTGTRTAAEWILKMDTSDVEQFYNSEISKLGLLKYFRDRGDDSFRAFNEHDQKWYIFSTKLKQIEPTGYCLYTPGFGRIMVDPEPEAPFPYFSEGPRLQISFCYAPTEKNENRIPFNNRCYIGDLADTDGFIGQHELPSQDWKKMRIQPFFNVESPSTAMQSEEFWIYIPRHMQKSTAFAVNGVEALTFFAGSATLTRSYKMETQQHICTHHSGSWGGRIMGVFCRSGEWVAGTSQNSLTTHRYCISTNTSEQHSSCCPLIPACMELSEETVNGAYQPGPLWRLGTHYSSFQYTVSCPAGDIFSELLQGRDSGLQGGFQWGHVVIAQLDEYVPSEIYTAVITVSASVEEDDLDIGYNTYAIMYPSGINVDTASEPAGQYLHLSRYDSTNPDWETGPSPPANLGAGLFSTYSEGRNASGALLIGFLESEE